MALARSALSHLDSALRLFEQVGENPRAVKVLVSMSRRSIRTRAHRHIAAYTAKTAGTRHWCYAGTGDAAPHGPSSQIIR